MREVAIRQIPINQVNREMAKKEDTIKGLNEIIEILRKENATLSEGYNELTEKVVRLEKQILKLKGKA